MSYILFLDDERNPGIYFQHGFMNTNAKIFIVRTSKEAIDCVDRNGLPSLMLLDHDLGGEDTTMVFLRSLAEVWDFSKVAPPHYMVHSANPTGAENIHSFMKSWKMVYNPE